MSDWGPNVRFTYNSVCSVDVYCLAVYMLAVRVVCSDRFVRNVQSPEITATTTTTVATESSTTSGLTSGATMTSDVTPTTPSLDATSDSSSTVIVGTTTTITTTATSPSKLAELIFRRLPPLLRAEFYRNHMKPTSSVDYMSTTTSSNVDQSSIDGTTTTPATTTTIDFKLLAWLKRMHPKLFFDIAAERRLNLHRTTTAGNEDTTTTTTSPNASSKRMDLESLLFLKRRRTTTQNPIAKMNLLKRLRNKTKQANRQLG